LPQALASRFQIEHQAVMDAQLLAHIDTLDAAVQNLSERIEFVLAPHQHVIEGLSTVPGVQAHAAQVLIAECGLDMTLGSRPSGTSQRGPERVPAITNQPAADAAGEPAPEPGWVLRRPAQIHDFRKRKALVRGCWGDKPEVPLQSQSRGTSSPGARR